MPAIKVLCKSKTVKLKAFHENVVNGFANSAFSAKLEELLVILAPGAKATIISHFNAQRSAKNIWRISNFRWKAIIEQAPHNANANPLAIPPMRLGPSRQVPASTVNLPDPVQQAGRFLLDLLRIEYNDRKGPICGLREDVAVELLKAPVGKYYRGEAPLNCPVMPEEGPHEWWEKLNQDCSEVTQPIAQLATFVMGLTPNSMSNKRTVSYFTWQNSHLCGAQKVSTLVCLAQIQQWEKNEDPNRPMRDPNQDVGHEDEKADKAESNSSADSEGAFNYDGLNNEDAKGAPRDLWGASQPTRQYNSEPGNRFVVSEVADLQSLAL
ncbi:hypothetical protein BC835DRAFT_1311463 [Cytidiella melzeri]|nr:hypothetical protein BC835DRAFT_1311463 [Cytidiella melzeri]